MTSRTRSPQNRKADAGDRRGPGRPGPHPERLDWSESPGRLRAALALAVVGAALLIAGPEAGLVRDSPARGFASTPLLAALAVVGPLLAIVLVLFGRAVTAAGVLTGAALLAPGRALVDLQFAQDALVTSRPELLVPTTLADLTPDTGVWLLVAGHIATAGAGILAAGRAGAAHGSAYRQELDAVPMRAVTGSAGSRATAADAPDIPGSAAESGGVTKSGATGLARASEPNATAALAGAGPAVDEPARGRAVGWALAFATLAAVGLFMPQFRSHTAFQLGDDLIDSPALVRAGLLIIVVAVVAGCVFAGVSARPVVARGVMIGVLLATAGVVLPPMVAGFSVDRLAPAPGPYLTLIALVLLTALILAVRTVAVPAPRTTDDTDARELRLETGRVHLVTGVLGVLAGVAALVGALGPQFAVDGLEQPESYANRQLIPAGLLVGVLGLMLLSARLAPTVRPAFVVSLGAIVLGGAATLDAAFTGAGISDHIHVGVGVWFTGVALVIAAAAAIGAAVAGGAERDDVDLTERTGHLSVAAPVAVAILLSVGAFGLPMITAPGFVAPGLWSQFRLASWGLLIAMAVVIIAGVVAVLARPARAAALLFGAAAVLGVHALEFPLTRDRTAAAAVGSGTWLSLACCLALLVAAGVALAGPTPQPPADEPANDEPAAGERTPEPEPETRKPVGKRARGRRTYNA